MSATLTQPVLSQKERRIAGRWIPNGAEEIKHPDGIAVAYIHGNFNVLAYAGSANKAAFHFRYRTRAEADAKVANFFLAQTSWKEIIKNRRAQENAPHTLIVGDVVVNSWGYDQTNIDCYQVTKKTDHFVWLKAIASALAPDEGCAPMSGRVVPRVGEFLADHEEVKHKASGVHVTFKHGGSTKWDGKQTFYCSWYA